MARTACVIGLAILAWTHEASGMPRFVRLGWTGEAFAVSPDASVVVGYGGALSGPAQSKAIRWSDGAGWSFLDSNYSQAFDASSGGSVIVGNRFGEEGEAIRWIPEAAPLHGFEGALGADAWGVSYDGEVIAGNVRWSFIPDSGYETEAFRWTTAGPEFLGDLPGGQFFSWAWGISGDGSVLVGESITDSGYEAFRWTRATGMVGLGRPPGDYRTVARAVSRDGSVVVGASASGLGSSAFRWTQEEGMASIGVGAAVAVSGDGSIVVGSTVAPGSTGNAAFIWDAEHGMRLLREVLVGTGVDLTGWDLLIGLGISDDGQTIVGAGQNPDGNVEAWLVQIPEPSTLSLLLFALGGLAASRFRACTRAARRAR